MIDLCPSQVINVKEVSMYVLYVFQWYVDKLTSSLHILSNAKHTAQL